MLEIGDNGVGLHHKAANGLGLNSIKNRVTSLKGNLDQVSDQGTVLRIRIPIPPTNNEPVTGYKYQDG